MAADFFAIIKYGLLSVCIDARELSNRNHTQKNFGRKENKPETRIDDANMQTMDISLFLNFGTIV